MSLGIMMSLIDLFAQIAVKIHCEDHDDEEYGTGTLISDGERCYVLTAGHCVKKKSNGNPFDSDSIELTSYAASTPYHQLRSMTSRKIRIMPYWRLRLRIFPYHYRKM